VNIPARFWSFITSNIVARIFQGIFRERKVKAQDVVPNDSYWVSVGVNLVVAGPVQAAEKPSLVTVLHRMRHARR